jgi:hypothetical protein
MLERSVYNDGFPSNTPGLTAWSAQHPQGAEIDESAYAALVGDLVTMQKAKTAGQAGTRINYVYPGTISVFKATARDAAKMVPPVKDAVIAANPMWGDIRLRVAGSDDFVIKARNAQGQRVLVAGEKIKVGWHPQDARALDP